MYTCLHSIVIEFNYSSRNYLHDNKVNVSMLFGLVPNFMHANTLASALGNCNDAYLNKALNC